MWIKHRPLYYVCPVSHHFINIYIYIYIYVSMYQFGFLKTGKFSLKCEVFQGLQNNYFCIPLFITTFQSWLSGKYWSIDKQFVNTRHLLNTWDHQELYMHTHCKVYALFRHCRIQFNILVWFQVDRRFLNKLTKMYLSCGHIDLLTKIRW